VAERRSSGIQSLAKRLPSQPVPVHIDENSRVLAACAYVPVLCLIPFVLDIEPLHFTRFHARQGIAIFVLQLLSGLAFFLPVAGNHTASVLLAALCIMALYGAIAALRGKCRPVPLLSTITGPSDDD